MWHGVSDIAMLLLTAGSFLKVIDFGIDPHNLRGILPPVLEALIFQASLILPLYGSYFIFLYWVELVHTSELKPDITITKMRPILIGYMIITACTLVPIAIWNAINDSARIDSIGRILHATLILSAAALSIVYGYRLSRIVKSMKRSLLRFLVVVNTFAISTAILMDRPIRSAVPAVGIH